MLKKDTRWSSINQSILAFGDDDALDLYMYVLSI